MRLFIAHLFLMVLIGFFLAWCFELGTTYGIGFSLVLWLLDKWVVDIEKATGYWDERLRKIKEGK